MADLTTPNKPRRSCVWPASSTDGDTNSLIALSPFLSLSSPYYFSVSPFRTVNIAYVSPIHVAKSQPPLEDLLINICDKLNRDHPKPPPSPINPLKESCGTVHKAQIVQEAQQTQQTQQAQQTQQTQKAQKAQKAQNAQKAATPPRMAGTGTETETTSEGSDVKTSKTSARTSDLSEEKSRTHSSHILPKDLQQNLDAIPSLQCLQDDDAEESEELKELDKGSAASKLDSAKSVEDRVIRKRKRKSMEQLKLLAEEYKRNPSWNKGTMSEVARRTGLSEAQVYKWGWDQKKKKLDTSL
jgi:hypothetical protein